MPSKSRNNRKLLASVQTAHLSREEELRLIKLAQAGDRDALSKLFSAHILWIFKASRNCSDDELMGSITGWLMGLQKFDVNSGYRLMTYAQAWMCSEKQEALIDSREFKPTTQIERAVYWLLGKYPSDEPHRILEHIRMHSKWGMEHELREIDLDRVKAAVSKLCCHVMSTSVVGFAGDEDGETYESRMPAQEQDPAQVIDDERLKLTLREVMHQMLLTRRERIIVEERILSETPLTLKKIGEKIGVTRERVRQIEIELIGRIRDEMKRRVVDE